MRQWFLTALLTGALVLTAGCDFEDGGLFGSAQAYQEDFHHSYPLKPGGNLNVENFNGSIEIAGWDQSTVDISGTKYGATPELRDGIKIDIVASGDSIRVRTIRPPSRRAAVLSPKRRRSRALGPTKVIPARSHASARSGFSDRKP